MKRLLAAAAATVLIVAAAPAQSPSATIVFTFSNPQLHPSQFTLTVHSDGTGTYKVAADGASPELTREVTIEMPLRQLLFSTAAKEHNFTKACDAGNHKLAFTGSKTIAYSGADGQGSCSFNYAHDAGLQKVSDDLIATSMTLEEGRKLELLLAHDRLELDAELGALADAAAEGQAQQLQNIAPILQSIAADGDVLLRARARAGALLASSKAPDH